MAVIYAPRNGGPRLEDRKALQSCACVKPPCLPRKMKLQRPLPRHRILPPLRRGQLDDLVPLILGSHAGIHDFWRRLGEIGYHTSYVTNMV